MGIKSSNRVNQFNISSSINMIKIVLIIASIIAMSMGQEHKLTMSSPSTLDLATTDILCWELDMGIQATTTTDTTDTSQVTSLPMVTTTAATTTPTDQSDPAMDTPASSETRTLTTTKLKHKSF